MTAEIAILNRTAVALAADSAATLMGGRSAKANNNADKLFHLCDGEPVGLMVFGSAEFMSVPLEPLVKGFRGCGLAGRQSSLLGYAEAFFEFLERMVFVSDYAKSAHIRGLAGSIIRPLIRKAVNRLFSGGAAKKSSDFRLAFTHFFLTEIKQEIEYVSSKDDCTIMVGMSREYLEDAFHADVVAVLEEQLSETPFRFSAEEKKEVEANTFTLLTLFISKNIYSDYSTGFAFAGFGAKDTFPSLCVWDTEGIIGSHVKRSLLKEVRIDPAGPRGHVESLAQSDVVQRYTEGIDPKLNKLLAEKLGDAIVGFGDALAEAWLPKKGRKRQTATATVRAAASKTVDAFLREVVDRAKDEEKQDITSVVNFMSKSELAQLAEALVEMTALRRRVSMEVETVGGPTDVAVISKGDGFVWIKRKHYFDPALNPRYFVGQRLALEMRRIHDEKTENPPD
jgi:hypothetical protein